MSSAVLAGHTLTCHKSGQRHPWSRGPLQQFSFLSRTHRHEDGEHFPVWASASLAEIWCTEEAQRIKKELRQALKPVKTCGVYGLQAAPLSKIKQIVESLEAQNPLTSPTEHLSLLAGKWNVLFTTIKVTGSRRIKLGLRDLVNISYLSQDIEASNRCATNKVGFNVPAFGIKDGELLLTASYEVASASRVSIALQEASLVPRQLQSIFEANFDLLLSVFNPEGHLDITYCDEELRCGRDEKGHIFVLERQKDSN